LVKIKKFSQNKHSHILNIASIVLWKIRRVWAKAILGRPPRRPYSLKLLIEVIPEVVIGDPDSSELPGCPTTALGHDG